MSARRGGRHAQVGVRRQGFGAALLLWRRMLFASRWGILVWSLVMAGLLYYMVQAVRTVMGPDGLQARAQVIGLPAGAMLSGPGYGLEDYTLQAMTANELLGGFAVAVAIMSLRLAVRHTRGDEEAGRTELLRALPVGRFAPLGAAVGTGLTANLGAAVLVFLALRACGFEANGSLGFALGLLLLGSVFTGVGVLCAQLSLTARTASAWAGMLLGLAYLLRAVGDAGQRGGGVLSWASPIGWIQQQRLFVQQRFWPLWLVLGLGVFLIAAAFALQARREVGAAVFSQRAGRGRAGLLGRTLLGFGLRMERNRMLCWAAAVLVAAVLTGSLAGAVADAFAQLPQLQALLGAPGADAQLDQLVMAALAKFLAFFAMVVGVFAVQSPHRLRRDELHHRGEVVLALPVSRWWLMGHQMLLGLLGSALLLAMAGLGLGIGAGSALAAPVLGSFVAASLWYLPVVACWLALSMLALGIEARGGAALVWVLLVGCILIGTYGPLLNVPQWVMDAEPFTSIAALEIVREGASAVPAAGFTAAALLLGALALGLYRRRDLRG